MLQTSMGGKYWDIHDFLCEEEKVMTKFQCDSYQNVELDQNNDYDQYEDLQKDAEIDIPLWLAIKLAQASFLDIQIPEIYRENFKKILIADPIIINLREKNLYYYESGVKLCQFIEDKSIGQILMDIYLERVKFFAKKSYHLKIEKCSLLQKKMSFLELNIFQKGRYASHTYRKYKERIKLNLYDDQHKTLKSLRVNNQ